MAIDRKYFLHRRSSRTIETARRIGIDIDIPKPRLPLAEQEQTDTM